MPYASVWPWGFAIRGVIALKCLIDNDVTDVTPFQSDILIAHPRSQWFGDYIDLHPFTSVYIMNRSRFTPAQAIHRRLARK
jgi:hypothetical protein